MNARRRFVLRIRDGHWLAAIGFVLIVCLFGCHPAGGVNGDSVPQPGHTTNVKPRPPVNPTKQAAIPPSVPADASGFCHDGTYTTAHSPQGKDEQCDGHGGVAEG